MGGQTCIRQGRTLAAHHHRATGLLDKCQLSQMDPRDALPESHRTVNRGGLLVTEQRCRVQVVHY